MTVGRRRPPGGRQVEVLEVGGRTRPVAGFQRPAQRVGRRRVVDGGGEVAVRRRVRSGHLGRRPPVEGVRVTPETTTLLQYQKKSKKIQQLLFHLIENYVKMSQESKLNKEICQNG